MEYDENDWGSPSESSVYSWEDYFWWHHGISSEYFPFEIMIDKLEKVCGICDKWGCGICGKKNCGICCNWGCGVCGKGSCGICGKRGCG